MTQEYVEMLRNALTAANAGIKQIHDDWLEPESWNSAGCGQAAAHCLNISLAIEDALAAPIPAAPLRPMSEAPKTLDKNGFPVQIVMYFRKWSPAIAWWNDGVKEWAIDCQYHGRSFKPTDEPIGWHPLPEVAAIQAAEEGK